MPLLLLSKFHRLVRAICVILLVLFFNGWCTPRAFASLSAGEWTPSSLRDYTIEALTVDSKLIVIATFESGSSSAEEWRGTFVPKEVLKSPVGYVLPPRLDATLSMRHAGRLALQFPSKDVSVLLFFGSNFTNPIAVGGFQDGVVLDSSADARSIVSPTVVDLTLRTIRDRKRVLSVVREEIQRVPATAEVTSAFTYWSAPQKWCHLI